MVRRILAAIALILLVLFACSRANASPKQVWYCDKWHKTVVHHDSYTTYYPIWVGKIMILEPIINPAYDTNKYNCIGWNKDIHKRVRMPHD